MSREIPNVPTMSPFPSRRGIFVVHTQQSGRSGELSRSTLATIGMPVAMTVRSSCNAAAACRSSKKSESDLPTTSSAVQPGASAASQPRLTSRKRLCRSLK
jgi:hypothetical protein